MMRQTMEGREGGNAFSLTQSSLSYVSVSASVFFAPLLLLEVVDPVPHLVDPADDGIRHLAEALLHLLEKRLHEDRQVLAVGGGAVLAGGGHLILLLVGHRRQHFEEPHTLSPDRRGRRAQG